MLFCVRCGTDSLQAHRLETIVVGDKNCGQRRRSRAAVAKLQATWGQPPRSLVPNRSRGLGSFSCVAGESVASVKSSQRVGYVLHVSKLWFPKQCGRKLHFCCPLAHPSGVWYAKQMESPFCFRCRFLFVFSHCSCVPRVSLRCLGPHRLPVVFVLCQSSLFRCCFWLCFLSLRLWLLLGLLVPVPLACLLPVVVFLPVPAVLPGTLFASRHCCALAITPLLRLSRTYGSSSLLLF